MPVTNKNGLQEVDLSAKENEEAITNKSPYYETPLRVAIINLMPTNTHGETHLFNMLSEVAPKLSVDFVQTSQPIFQKPIENQCERNYKTFNEIKKNSYDAMIITGTPMEKITPRESAYWRELTDIMDYARNNVYTTMFLYGGALAALFHYYGIPRNIYDKDNSLTQSPFDQSINTPLSRYFYYLDEDIKSSDELVTISKSDETGVRIVVTNDRRMIFVLADKELDTATADTEYKRYILDEQELEIKQRLSNPDNLADDSIEGLKFSDWLDYCIYKRYNTANSHNRNIVSKFGGTSLADANQFNKVKNIIMSVTDRNHIVVSAPGKRSNTDTKITDILTSCYNLQNQKLELVQKELEIKNKKIKIEKEIESAVKTIEERFIALCDDLDLKDSTKEELRSVIDQIKDSSDKDFILSRGEYLNALIMSEFLHYKFIDAKELIYFDNNGMLDENKTYTAIKKSITKDEKVVIPGFYGTDCNGNIKTFDRGGSDITGSIIARGLDADLYENWTDVPGVMTADPKKVKDAKTIESMTYSELLSMSSNGANVYHPDAIKPVAEVNIPINIKNTNNPLQSGTIISGI